MRLIVAALLLVALTISPSITMAGADESQMSFSPSSAPPGTEVTVEIQLDRPPVDGTSIGMFLERAIDDPEAFTVTDPVPFDADGYALFTFTVPDAAPGEYYPQFACVNASASGDACDDPEFPNFGPLLDVVFTVTDPVPPSDYEEVVFRVTLEGPVNPTHTFAVQRECPEEICVTEAIVLVCSPPDDSHRLPACSATTYEFTSEIRAGLTVEYALIRWTTPDLRHTSDQPEEHLHGSSVVQDGRQVISLGYVYPGGTPAATATPVASTLPDAAMPSGMGSAISPFIVAALGLFLIGSVGVYVTAKGRTQ